MPPKTKSIWMDGKQVEWEKATVHVLSQGLHYGAGVFEGIRCYKTPKGPALFRLDEHVKRFFASAKILGLELKYKESQLRQAIIETVKANGLEDCYVRPLAFGGNGGFNLVMRGTPTHMIVAVWPWGDYLSGGDPNAGVKVKTSSFIRPHPNSTMIKAKITGNYVNSILAKQEAEDAGMHEALMLDSNGHVMEGTGENIFAVRNGTVYTPPAKSILEGITRASVMEIARGAGIQVVEEMLSRDQLYVADEVFMTGTAAEVAAVGEIDRRTIGDGMIGPVAKRVREAYMNATHGRDPKYEKWLTRVEMG